MRRWVLLGGVCLCTAVSAADAKVTAPQFAIVRTAGVPRIAVNGAAVAVKDGFGERLCASTIRRISSAV